jgi:hypothetical protein
MRAVAARRSTIFDFVASNAEKAEKGKKLKF